MPAEIERVDPISLEIAIIEKFKSTIKEIQACAIENSEFDDGALPDPNISIVTPYKNGVHFSDRECPSHGTEEFYSVTNSEAGETIAVEAILFERAPDQRIDILRIASGEIKVKEGMIQAHNIHLLRQAMRKLSIIKNSFSSNGQSESESPLPQSPDLNSATLN